MREVVAHPGRRFSTQRVVAACIGLVMVALFGVFTLRVLGQQGMRFGGFGVNAVGREASIQARPVPDFTLALYDGGTFRLSEQRGRVVVVNYWASWCPPCREEAPILEAVWQAYRDRDVVFLGVDIWDTEREARAFLEQFGVTYPNGLDTSGTLAVEAGVTGIPETFFVDRQRMLVRRRIGPISEGQLRAIVDELLN